MDNSGASVCDTISPCDYLNKTWIPLSSQTVAIKTLLPNSIVDNPWSATWTLRKYKLAYMSEQNRKVHEHCLGNVDGNRR